MLTAKRKQLDQKIGTLEAELRAALARKERAMQEWNRAWGGVDNAHAALDLADAAVRDRFEELCRARDELIDLLPRQRGGD